MDKEEILEKSIKENKYADERAMQVRDQAWKIAEPSGILLGSILVMFETSKTGEFNPTVLIILIVVMFISELICAIRLKTKNNILCSILFGSLLIGLLIKYFVIIFGS